MSFILLSAVGLSRILFFLLVFYFVMRIVSRILAANRFSSRQSSYENEKRKKDSDGDITIRFSKNGKKKIDKDDGEYVDFEEM